VIGIIVPMADFEIVRLANGVHSVRSNAENETFHPVLGPLDEARELYGSQLGFREKIVTLQREYVIWDIGLGAAGNVLTLLISSDGTRSRLRIVSFDRTLEPLKLAIRHADQLMYPLDYVRELEQLASDGHVSIQRGYREVDWRVNVGDFPMLVASADAEGWPKPDAILFDAFSPAKNPAMWTLPLFSRIYELLDPQRPCAMPTYSRSTMLRVTLLLAGFFVGVGREIGEKEETTIAANDLSQIESPLPVSWLKRARNSTCAEPLIEPAYTRAPLSEASWEKLQAHPQFNT
jgi:tRNA U34 5-methylaminomethyl-2-thiouridine-forming methyltransferase MnmC